MRTVMILALGLTAVASAASAGDSSRAPSEVRLSVRSADLADPAAAQKLYGRLRMASRQACDSDMGRNLAVREADRACARQSLDAAVQRLNQPALSTVHAQATGRGAAIRAVASIDAP